MVSLEQKESIEMEKHESNKRDDAMNLRKPVLGKPTIRRPLLRENIFTRELTSPKKPNL